MSPSPQDQAIAARRVLNDDVLNSVAQTNARRRSQYHEQILQWIGYRDELQGRGEVPPIPDPPRAWATRPHEYTAEESAYDAKYPGIDPRIDDYETDQPVEPKYEDKPYPVASGAVIGVSIGGGMFSAGYVEGGKEIQDKTPAGMKVTGISRDGVHGDFVKQAAFVGPGWWLKVA